MANIKPKCDFCNLPATYDTMTTTGTWAYCCDTHYKRYGSETRGLFTKLADIAPTVIAHKQCTICGCTKPIGDFYEYTDHADVKRNRSECKECNLSERKAASFRKAKIGRKA